jgi:hypothetical protein
MIKRSRGPGQSWWTFLRNHAPEIAAMVAELEDPYILIHEKKLSSLQRPQGPCQLRPVRTPAGET